MFSICLYSSIVLIKTHPVQLHWWGVVGACAALHQVSMVLFDRIGASSNFQEPSLSKWNRASMKQSLEKKSWRRDEENVGEVEPISDRAGSRKDLKGGVEVQNCGCSDQRRVELSYSIMFLFGRQFHTEVGIPENSEASVGRWNCYKTFWALLTSGTLLRGLLSTYFGLRKSYIWYQMQKSNWSSMIRH